MSGFYNQALLTWIDHNGKTATSFLATQDQSSGAAADYETLAAAFDACADAKVAVVQMQSTLIRVVTPVSGVYSTVWDRGVCFSNNSVTNVGQRQAIVGPKADIFLGDTVTVDLTNANIMALQAAIQDVIGDGAGNPCGPFNRGRRQNAGGS